MVKSMTANTDNDKKLNSQQISRITIEGYKSIERCDLELGRINVLIGSNGSGKSNFISLFKLLQSMIDGQLQLYVARHGSPNAFFYQGIKHTTAIDVKFYFGNNGYHFNLVPTMDNRIMFAGEWFYWKQIDERMIASGNLESNWRKGTGTRIDNFVKPILEGQKWRVYHFHDTGDMAFIKQKGRIQDNAELAPDARNLAAFLYRLKLTASNAYDAIVRTVRMVAPYFWDFYLRPDPFDETLISLEWTDIAGENLFTAAQLSDGTLRFICLATLLLQPQELMPDTILIDEPELGLHPYAISVLSALIKKASVDSQIIISTQSVELLNEFQVEDIIVVNHNGKRSNFSRLDKEELRIWLEEEYSIGDLWKSNIIGGRP